MFTGLIQETGSILNLDKRGGVHHITVHAPTLASQLRVGDSIAVSGVCLTALGIAPEEHPDRFEADLAEETVRRTSLSQLAPGAVVNLELPTAAGAPLGGHVVQGHVDAVGRVEGWKADAEFRWLTVSFPPQLAAFIIPKGSIAVDGISLTVAVLARDRFDVQIVPFTTEHTNLSRVRVGDTVNLECDMVGKYVVRAVELAGVTVAGARER